MTVENCIKLLEAYKKQAENPVDERRRDLFGVERENAIYQSKKNYEMMKAHILNSRKFRDHPILKELQDEDNNKEKIKDGKKSKR